MLTMPLVKVTNQTITITNKNETSYWYLLHYSEFRFFMHWMSYGGHLRKFSIQFWQS